MKILRNALRLSAVFLVSPAWAGGPVTVQSNGGVLSIPGHPSDTLAPAQIPAFTGGDVVCPGGTVVCTVPTKLSHVANNTALAAWASTAYPAMRDAFATAGDGGKAVFNFFPGYTCATAPATPSADGFSCIPSTVVAGAWLPDPATWFQGLTPQQFGALGNSNGTTGNGHDDSPPLQAWLNFGQLNRVARLKLPMQNFTYYRTTAPLTLNYTGAFIQGDYCSPGYSGNFLPGAGSVLFFDHPGQGIQFNAGESTFQDMCTYRAQPSPAGVQTAATGATTAGSPNVVLTAPNSAIKVFDPITGSGVPAGSVVITNTGGTTIAISQNATATASGVALTTAHFIPATFDYDIYSAADLDIIHSVIVDPTKGIYLSAGRLWIDGLKGEPLTIGIAVYGSLDTDKWNNIHFWPFASASAPATYSWKLQNLIDLQLNRMDDGSITNFSSFGSAYCIYFSYNSAGPVAGPSNLLSLTNALCDSVGNGAGIYVNPGVSGLTADFVNFKTQSANAPGNAPWNSVNVDIEGSNSRLTFDGGFFGGFAAGSAFVVNGTGNRVTLPDAHFGGWGIRNTAAPAISAAVGNAVNYGGAFPFFDLSSGVGDSTYYGGTLYYLPNAPTVPVLLPLGSGRISIVDLGSHQTVTAQVGGGGVSIAQSSTEYVNAGGGPDATITANTPSGKIGIGFDTTQGGYVIYNNTGTAVSYVFQADQPLPAP